MRPSGLGGSFTGGEIDILSTSRVLGESVTLALEVMDVDRPLASCPVHLTEGTRGAKGSIFSGTDSSGWLQIRLTANAVAGQFEVQFRLDPRPALPSTLVPLFRWLKALQPPHDLKIRWPSGLEMRSKVRTPSPIDEGIGKVVESLAHLQEASGRYWEMSPSLIGEEGQEIVTARYPAKGRKYRAYMEIIQPEFEPVGAGVGGSVEMVVLSNSSVSKTVGSSWRVEQFP